MMRRLIGEVDFFKWPTIRKLDSNIRGLFSDFDEGQVFLTSSGRASLDIILSYFRESGHLNDKNEEVWVPRWIGSWVYNIMQKRCFPSILPSESTKGILVYHQYGYPQNLDKIMAKAWENNWFVIEDCAQAIRSYYKSKRVGLIGDVGIFSFSKFFPSLTGGAIVTKNGQMAEYIRDRLNNARNWGGTLSFLSKVFYEKSNSRRTKSFWGKWIEMSDNVYDLNVRLNSISKKIINQKLCGKALIKRNENKDFYLGQLANFNVFDGIDDHESVTPYIMPLFVAENRLNSVVKQLLAQGVVTRVYYFDVNRDMENPDFKKCIWLPVHEGVNHKIRSLIVDTIKRSFNGKS